MCITCGIFLLKNPDRETVSDLTCLPNIGPAIAADLKLAGVQHPKDLIGRDPYQLYAALCRKTGQRHDPCMIDVFLAVVDFMEGGEAAPWWKFTEKRKRHLAGC